MNWFMILLIGIFIFMPVITLIHECGHLFFLKLFDDITDYRITLGYGKSILTLGNIEICPLYFFYGRTTPDDIFDSSKLHNILFQFGGILFSLISIILLFILNKLHLISNYVYTPFLDFSVWCTFTAIIPIKYPDGNISDGLRILRTIKAN